VSDEFTVPLCRTHHRALHRSGSEYLWWESVGIDPLKVARKLWRQTQTKGRIGADRRSPQVAYTVTIETSPADASPASPGQDLL
jgi:hypothetical protein